MRGIRSLLRLSCRYVHSSKQFVIAYDKFKDCLTASQLCNITEKALRRSLEKYDLKVTTIPLADGGDGFLDCIEKSFLSTKENSSSHLFNQYTMQKINTTVTGPLGSPTNVTPLIIRRLLTY